MTDRAVDIWRFQEDLTRRLATGAGVSIVLGAGMLLPGSGLWSGIAFQFIGWGAIDLVIALVGQGAAKKKKARLGGDTSGMDVLKEARNLGRVLWINMVLDVLYILGGMIITTYYISKNPLWLGTGIGVVIQGAFLFVLDLFHAIKIKKEFLGEKNE